MNPSPLKIGLYGGTFDPIHNGHLLLARDALERLKLSKIVFIPANLSPHKLRKPPAPADIRCEMIQAAIEGEKYFELDRCEVEREGPSYTVDTARLYREKFPEAQLYYLVGDDNLEELNTWREVDQLKELVQFVVLTRAGVPFLSGLPIISRNIELSSTEIRNRVARGSSIRYMVPVATCDVIKKHRLYRND